MPSTSEKQRRFLFARKGAAWVKQHGFEKLRRGGKKGAGKHG
jgi:hypothetical protein